MIQFDDSVTAGNLPATQEYAVYYVDGRYSNESEVRARLPHAKAYAGITVVAPGKTGKAVAFCDCETGDLTPAQAEAWVAEQIRLGVQLVGVYANLSTWAAGLYGALAVHGERIKRWCAAYDQDPSLTLSYQGKSYSFDAHQWAGGMTSAVDKNVAADDFFTPHEAPKPPKPPAKPSGVVHFIGTYNINTDRYTIKKMPGTAKYAGPSLTKKATVTIQVGKTHSGPRVNIFRSN